jgi:sulfite reductase (NADPH) hemoprotein beta-component
VVVITTYLGLRSSSEETFLQCYRRVGDKPFKEAVYKDSSARDEESEQAVA